MDSHELAALFERYGYFVQRRCRMLLGSVPDAEDLTQEVFMRAQRYASSLTAPVTLAWLYSIATRCCFDHRARRWREEPLDLPTLTGLANDAQTPGALPGDPDRQALIALLLPRLDATSREIVVLHHLEGWTQEEVAQKTGYSRRTVGKKLAAYAALRDQEWARTELFRSEATR